MKSDNLENLFTDEQIRELTAGRARAFKRDKDGAELLREATAYARRHEPDIDGEELMREVCRLAYIRGFRHGIEEVSACPFIEDFELPDIEDAD